MLFSYKIYLLTLKLIIFNNYETFVSCFDMKMCASEAIKI